MKDGRFVKNRNHAFLEILNEMTNEESMTSEATLRQRQRQQQQQQGPVDSKRPPLVQKQRKLS